MLLKEWAYLSPSYFEPNSDALNNYNIKSKNYIFIREVSTKTLNYVGQESNLLYRISDYLPKNIKVLLSLEDKSKINLYPKDWILLKEPVENIHSLIYFSKIVISSGDSMAREGSVMGVTSIYTGKREMAANKVLENYGVLFHYNINELCTLIPKFFEIDFAQEETREKISSDFIDLVDFMINVIHSELEYIGEKN